MSIEIREVKTRQELKKFIRFPHSIYKGNAYWVPGLDFDEMNTLSRNKNPAFEVCEARYWLAYKDGKIAGRIAGILNHAYIEKWKNRYIRFGWIDFIDDEEVSKALLQAVENWAKEIGMTAVHGPLGFTDLDYEGMLVEGFDKLGTMATIYNHPYYPVHLEKLGYRKDVDWVEYESSVPTEIPARIEEIAANVREKLNLRTLKVKKAKELLPYAPRIFEVVDASYSGLYGTVPLTKKQVEAYTKQYFGFIRPDFVSVVVDGNDRVIGFGITMPSLSKALQKSRGKLFPFGFIHLLRALKKNDMADMYLIGILPEYQGKGVNALILCEIGKTFIQNGIVHVETNPELEQNLKVQAQWKFFDTRQHKRRRVFIKQIA
ncbi:MAG: hypothetical protein COT43_01900 [Candidatus Marinimicrobia bacterium CG08_land_8_20_14_0_20_45_22]|nr:MAG: hypothetical protein COT43_01900 [Candidatus Marinimicrobia bacterium CG08_land_8_20_14_0_20_45_22]